MLLHYLCYFNKKIFLIIFISYINNLIYSNQDLDKINKYINIYYKFPYERPTSETLIIDLDNIYNGGYYDLENILYPNNFIVFKHIKLWWPENVYINDKATQKLFFEENIKPYLNIYDPEHRSNENKSVYERFIHLENKYNISIQDIEVNDKILNNINKKNILSYPLKGIYIHYDIGCILFY
jgi:hypothetical protein